MARAGRIAKNTTYLTIASVFQKLISFGYYAYLADAIGAGSLGKYTFALTFTSVFIIFMDFGLGPLLTREAAKDESKLQDHFERIFSIKLVLIGVSLVALFASITIAEPLFTNIDWSDVTLVYLGAVIILFDTLTFTFFSVFRALKQMQWEAIGIVIYQALILIVGYLVLRAGMPLPYVLGAILTGSLFQVIYMFILILRKTDLKFRFVWDWKKVRHILAMSAPFAIAGVIFRINGSADTMMLKVMVGDSHAGWYSLAFKLTFALTVLPGAFATSYYPAVSALYKTAREKVHIVFESGLFYMMIISFPIVAGVAVLGDDIIYAVWGSNWEASVTPLWIFMIGLPFVFFNYPIGNFLNAVNRQKLNTLNMSIALVVNIVLNVILIPYYTFNGAAIAAVASAIVLVALGLPWVYKISPFNFAFLLKKFSLVAAAAGLMSFVLFFVQHNYSLIVLIPMGVLLYVSALLLTNGITKEELQKFKSSLIKRG
ncbi:MAG: oligosaccharide flippase family protein [Candidatus Kerfeldbacteria bacterium]